MSARRDVAPPEAKAAMAKLRAVRKSQGLTLREIADRTGCSHATISRIENGHADPQLATVIRYVNALGMRLSVTHDQAASRAATHRAQPDHDATAAHQRHTGPTTSTNP